MSFPVYALAIMRACITASVPELHSLTISADRIILQSRSTSLKLSSVSRPDVIPASSASITARLTIGSPCPRIMAP
jgi:hypothetical protein